MNLRERAYKELVTGDFKGPKVKKELLDEIFGVVDRFISAHIAATQEQYKADFTGTLPDKIAGEMFATYLDLKVELGPGRI